MSRVVFTIGVVGKRPHVSNETEELRLEPEIKLRRSPQLWFMLHTPSLI